MSEKEIKEGDFVRVKGRETSCEVLIAKEGINVIAIEETRKYATTYNRQEVERIDPKTAFLAELKDLLDKYNASIYVDYDQSDEIYTTTIAVGEDSVKYSYTYGIDTDNMFNYDK